MRYLKLFLLALVLGFVHLALLKLALGTQGLPYLFWPSVVFRTLLLVLAAIPFALQSALVGHLQLSLHPLLLYTAYYSVVITVFPRIVALWRVARAPAQMGRRAVLLGGGVVALGTAGLAKQSTELHVLEYPLPVKDLPKALNGLRVALLADIHRGPVVSQSFLEEVVDRVNSLSPDLVLMPGDFVAKSPRFFPDIERALRRLNPSIASFATLGNHDVWVGREQAMACLQGAGVIPLQNRAVYLGADRSLKDGPAIGESLCLAGVDDLWTGEPDFSFLASVPTEIPVFLLSHHPDVAEDFQNSAQRIDWQFSGHTHGGQIVLPAVGALATASSYGDKYLYGWCQGPKWPVFTTCGIGTSSVPVRVGTQSEILLFTLGA